MNLKVGESPKLSLVDGGGSDAVQDKQKTCAWPNS